MLVNCQVQSKQCSSMLSVHYSKACLSVKPQNRPWQKQDFQIENNRSYPVYCVWCMPVFPGTQQFQIEKTSEECPGNLWQLIRWTQSRSARHNLKRALHSALNDARDSSRAPTASEQREGRRRKQAFLCLSNSQCSLLTAKVFCTFTKLMYRFECYNYR